MLLPKGGEEFGQFGQRFAEEGGHFLQDSRGRDCASRDAHLDFALRLAQGRWGTSGYDVCTLMRYAWERSHSSALTEGTAFLNTRMKALRKQRC